MLLALDTSTRQAGIALYQGARGVIAEYNWQAGRQHTVELMPEVARLLAAAHVSANDLEVVAVALGPGSFTGLRVALAAAKGLALARGLALLGIPTLDVVAYPHREQPLPVVAVVQAGRGRLCWAVYTPPAGGPAHPSPVAFELTGAAEMAERLAAGSSAQPGSGAGSGNPAHRQHARAANSEAHRVGAGDARAAGERPDVGSAAPYPPGGPLLFAGELSDSDRATLAARLGERARCLPPALGLRRAACLAELAWSRFAAGHSDDPAALSPIYMSEPVTGERLAVARPVAP